MKKETFETERVEAVQVIYYFRDWKGTVQDWQEAFFQLLAWKNTFGIPYKLDILSGNLTGPYMYMVIGADKLESVTDMLDGKGYEKEHQKTWTLNLMKINVEYADEFDEFYINEV